MLEWRNSFYSHVVQKSFEDSLKNKEDVIRVINKEFNELAEPVKELSKVHKNEGIYRYQIYDRILEVDFQDTTVKFYQIYLGSFDHEEKEKRLVTEFIHNGNVFVEPDERRGQPDRFISKRNIDEIFKNVFTFGSAIRY
ncbi:hypothetical protein M5X00_04950 [Paenibacillus alvei]|uniref:hypothetical protein n=1 Tax=Paenibacillus alvei TaxID=44250 RepID=UPI000289DEBF|nr:hypothetical protein [Paenibacillus alvei]EJW16986.1 hypothetical protein PAV_4c00650 [Paenibacillus alvei DSM 29]MCY9539099.1 hypothetical protein [Paenibacillus alvei]MCY9707976.1 hypothetical protein [Paenibacillus alvei]MCY9734429.1 hypothetical protein [Paenibacillus alvei]MCY9753607.1 hypothetical protein [Paenibacillus alvei]